MSSLFELEEEYVYIIDSNDRIKERMEEIERAREEELLRKEQEIQEKIQTFLDSLEYDEEGKPVFPTDDEGNVVLTIPEDDDGNPLVNIDEEGNLLLPDMGGMGGYDGESFGSDEYDEESGQIQMSPDEIIENANAQAQMIIDDANSQAEAIKKVAADDGEKQGYTDGLARGEAEFEAQKNALNAEHQQMMAELQEMKVNMEAEVVDIVCDVVERAFGILFGDSKELILHLVDNTLLNIESSKTFLIRVSEEDHAFLSENKESLMARLGTDVTLDLIMDPVMAPGTCVIETDGGVFNCGIDKQMEGLLRDIRLLSTQ